jgi:uncharacterized damage-inducible protein DinB
LGLKNIQRTTIVALLVPVMLRAQSPGSAAPTANPVTASFKVITARFSGYLRAAFDSIPADKYLYRPTPPQQSIGYIAQHLVDANYSLCERFGELKRVRSEKDALPDTVKAKWPKDTLVTRLRASFAFCDAAMAQLSDATLGTPVPYGPPEGRAMALPATALVFFITDLAEHYSQLSGYMRLLGMVPPSALPPRARTAIALPSAVLSQYIGTYDLPPSLLQNAPAFIIDVTAKDGGLYVKPNGRPERRIWPETPTDFFIKEVDVQVSFLKDASGAVTGLVIHQNGEDRAAKKVH